MAEEHQRIVLLNTMISSSTTRAREHKAPTLGGLHLLKILDERRKKKWAVEFFPGEGKTGKDDDKLNEAQLEEKRLKICAGQDCLRLRRIRFTEANGFTYATLLIEWIDASIKSFPVVHLETYDGREISGETKERGATTTHIVVRLPAENVFDDGKYRCAVEVVHPVTRTDIETFLCRQIRRHASAVDMSFTATTHKGKKPETKEYRYTPRLELCADVGRSLDTAGEDRKLSHMVFTKRSEKQIIGKGLAVHQEEFLADVEYRVAASEGPADPDEQKTWLQQLQDWYFSKGCEVRVYYRNAKGAVIGGDVHKSIAGAADLLMCQREHILLDKAAKNWVSNIDDEVAGQLVELIDRDELWAK